MIEHFKTYILEDHLLTCFVSIDKLNGKTNGKITEPIIIICFTSEINNGRNLKFSLNLCIYNKIQAFLMFMCAF